MLIGHFNLLKKKHIVVCLIWFPGQFHSSVNTDLFKWGSFWIDRCMVNFCGVWCGKLDQLKNYTILIFCCLNLKTWLFHYCRDGVLVCFLPVVHHYHWFPLPRVSGWKTGTCLIISMSFSATSYLPPTNYPPYGFPEWINPMWGYFI